MKINQEKFNIADFERTKDKKWTLLNKILYNMCSDYPLHVSSEEIRAKICLIGRAYAAAIERRTKKRHINDDFYDYVANEFVKFNKENKFDMKIQSLKNKEFNEDTLKQVLLIHKELTQFFKKLTGSEKRSLASKYLHFHVPIFPIYDSRAKDSLNNVVRGRFLKTEGDKDYSKFCYKILFLYNSIKEQTGKAPTLREIDTYLINVANNKLNRKNGLN